jgi:hypothetical protein
MIGMKLRRDSRESPIANPTASPIAADIAKPTANSQNAIPSAAGTP